MDWAAWAILTLLIVAVVGFLTLIVLVLQYWTVTDAIRLQKEQEEVDRMDRELKETFPPKKIGGEMTLVPLPELRIKLSKEDCARAFVTPEQINDAYDAVISYEKKIKK